MRPPTPGSDELRFVASPSERAAGPRSGARPDASPGAGAIRGRGVATNPGNRFERIHLELERELGEEAQNRVPTVFLRDRSRQIVATNESPDVGFSASVNPYRGCEHGCVYCYARPTHEYLGFSAGLDFETRILVKPEAPVLLRRALESPRWEPRTLGLSGVTDPYQPAEARLALTRGCLEVLADFRNPVAVITKNQLVTRDRDLLAILARFRACVVYLSVTTLDRHLHRIMEPRTTLPARRLDAIRTLSEAGVPTGVMIGPVIPGLTDHEIPRILEAAARAGAGFAGKILLRLPFAVAPLFDRWLATHLPERRGKVLKRIRALRGGRLNDPRFGSRMRGTGLFADQIEQLFEVSRRRAGLAPSGPRLSTQAFRRVSRGQLALF